VISHRGSQKSTEKALKLSGGLQERHRLYILVPTANNEQYKQSIEENNKETPTFDEQYDGEKQLELKCHHILPSSNNLPFLILLPDP
jgi:hypothetical protein